jgi:hypothetical protein
VENVAPIVCPACSFEQHAGGAECSRCGVVFAKARPAAVPTFAAPVSSTPVRPAKPPWTMVGIALAVAALAHALPVTRFLLSPLVTLLHELGHAAAAWLLGCPAIPAFDFVYGGGVTYHKNFQLPLALLIAGGMAWLGWTFRRNPRTLGLIVGLAALWVFVLSSDWRREIVISSMGHGGELILGGVLLYMALSGRGWRMPEVERPLGAFAAFFVLLQTVTFAWKLRSDAGFLSWYREGKGGALMNDLEVIALDIKIWTGAEVDIVQVAGWLLAVSLVPALLAVTAWVYRARVNAFARSLLLLDPD